MYIYLGFGVLSALKEVVTFSETSGFAFCDLTVPRVLKQIYSQILGDVCLQILNIQLIFFII